MGSVCQQPNSKSDQSACSGKQYEWFDYKTKDVKIDETKHPQKCFPSEAILLLTAELKGKKKKHYTRCTMLLMTNLASAALFSILPHTTRSCVTFSNGPSDRSPASLSVTFDKPGGQERDKRVLRGKNTQQQIRKFCSNYKRQKLLVRDLGTLMGHHCLACAVNTHQQVKPKS